MLLLLSSVTIGGRGQGWGLVEGKVNFARGKRMLCD